MTKEQKDEILKSMAEERNYYVKERDRHIAEEEGKIIGADYMFQKLIAILKTEIEPQETATQIIGKYKAESEDKE